ncbi:MAG: DJ-1/PfpI family protein [Bradyrhizobium sp.]|uniref:DJ-1/PfpI family protein n=1 Tax=Bradyrhizobium sp. TaxID=376 RepID=UPI001DC2B66B|nr:DJ-1/PfpI family protein [Bradyrhizobium sp.]MBV9566278.1 DJ-1/PfpI family protein [Bradyrhizobium sp.]
MDRRQFNATLMMGSLAGLLAPTVNAQQTAAGTGPAKPVIGMLIYSDMILLDLVGPLTAFNILQTDVRLIAQTPEPVSTDVGLTVTPTATFDRASSALDVLFVPGGLRGTIEAMKDQATIDFLKSAGNQAHYVTSVCTGSLLLGAAGLLKGYNATSHWYVRDLLPLMGATTLKERVVEDRNRITAGGVTAGIDFGLTLAAKLRGEDAAKRIQLLLEYDPRPPFAAGTPDQAGAALTEDIRHRRGALIREAEQAARAAGGRLGI